jgi:hypothetical protein
MSHDQPAGPAVHSFFADHLITVTGVRASVAIERYAGVMQRQTGMCWWWPR